MINNGVVWKYPMLYRMDKKPDWNVFLNIPRSTTRRERDFRFRLISEESIEEMEMKPRILVVEKVEKFNESSSVINFLLSPQLEHRRKPRLPTPL